MRKKVRKIFFEICEGLEFFMALAAIAGIVIAIIAMLPEMGEFWLHRQQAGAFLEFLDCIFAIVIGIEFVKMLCKPNAENVIEVLIFLISRHMIIQESTAVEDLLAVVSVCILFIVQRYLKKAESCIGSEAEQIQKVKEKQKESAET
jgi:hypothetical protein